MQPQPTQHIRGTPGLVLLSLLMACLLTATAAPIPTDHWPQWRGPARNGILPPTTPPWPDHLDESHLHKAWKIPLAESYSGPVIWGNKVFVTETREKRSEAAIAIDRHSGKTLWRHEWEGSLSVPFFAKANGDWIRSTPATDGRRLFVAGMRDVLVALDTTDGHELWRADFVNQFHTPLPSFGFVSSPLLDGDALYVQAGAAVIRLNANTGKVQWRSLEDGGGMWGSAFSSPILTTLAGEPQLIAQSRDLLAGLSPSSGTILWSRKIEAFRGMNILTPQPFEDGLLTSSYGGKTILHAIAKTDQLHTVSERWTLKTQGNMTSPVILGDHAYLLLRNQRFTCINVRTGTERWTTSQSFGKYWSLVANHSRILALDQRGQLFLLQANPDRFDLLDQRTVSEEDSWAHLAVSANQLFVRDLHGLSAWTWTTAATTPKSQPAP